jgi:hypothetical protein
MNLTGKEAARRIREHNKIHQRKEPSNSPIITEILEVAAVLFEKVDAGEYQVVKHGRWIKLDRDIAVCSECGRHENALLVDSYPYCHCGAKMDLKDGENE